MREPILLNLAWYICTSGWINVDRIFFVCQGELVLLLVVAFNHFRSNPKMFGCSLLGFITYSYTDINTQYTVYTQKHWNTVLVTVIFHGYMLMDSFKNTLWTMIPKASPTINSHMHLYKKHRCQCSDRSRALNACRHWNHIKGKSITHYTRRWRHIHCVHKKMDFRRNTIYIGLHFPSLSLNCAHNV